MYLKSDVGPRERPTPQERFRHGGDPAPTVPQGPPHITLDLRVNRPQQVGCGPVDAPQRENVAPWSRRARASGGPEKYEASCD
jgi:hypothetical protein